MTQGSVWQCSLRKESVGPPGSAKTSVREILPVLEAAFSSG